MSEIAGQFCSIKKYLKKLFLKNFVYIIDSLPKLKKKKKKSIATLQKDHIEMNKTQHWQEAIARQEHGNRSQHRTWSLAAISVNRRKARLELKFVTSHKPR